MRYLRARFTGYIGFYNGMGLDVVDIDFSKCMHNIVLICGANGTGKSKICRINASADIIPIVTIFFVRICCDEVTPAHISPSFATAKRTAAVIAMTTIKPTFSVTVFHKFSISLSSFLRIYARIIEN